MMTSSVVEVPLRTGAHTKRGWLSALRSPLWFCLIFALLVRIWLIFYTHGFVDMDESLVGVQAQHILRGEFPIYYYGQPYMGSLEPYLISLVFAMFGSSPLTLRIEPLLLSLVLVWLSWRFAELMARQARLSNVARTWFSTTVSLLAALPPLYNLVIEMRTWGGHIEIYILMLLLLTSGWKLVQRWEAASQREILMRWLGIGVIIGVGFWVYPLIVSAVLAAFIWIDALLFWKFLQSLGWVPLAADGRQESFAFHGKRMLLGLSVVPGVVLGFAPGIYWGALHQWANIWYLLSPGSDGGNSVHLLHRYPNRLAVINGTVGLYEKCLVPHLYGGTLPTQSLTNSSVFSFQSLELLNIGSIILVLGGLIASLIWQHSLFRVLPRLVGLPLLFAVCTIVCFCFSNVVGHSLFEPCIRDGVGRYAAPVLLALPFFLAGIVALVVEYFSKRDKRSEGSRRVPGRRLSRFAVIQCGLAAVLLMYVFFIGTTYVQSDPQYIFQSFTCNRAPYDTSKIIAYLQEHNIHYLWGTHALGDTLIFQSKGSIIVTDPRIVNAGALNRLPQDVLAVEHADRASVIDMVAHTDPMPKLVQAINVLGVKYTLIRIPSQPGNVDILILTPVSRTLTSTEAISYGAWNFHC
ncbi:hypothetical protein [Tengunoibacter tsumagoiensis]|uniref:Glycosyltransferase RgtA/B/C/D-like domain-containing protein n=1 Tax=Tengunoibacter tsumagoiensis TaxID=2014871 RepID=A0A401ZZG5_9CHLR|nr:hypothetical protein [Tengunoibacter tsumagoiensis]GCE12236.1 hypothetical protein KTT_20950 [Tengunoibacter tsumagoiensis]